MEPFTPLPVSEEKSFTTISENDTLSSSAFFMIAEASGC